jgi:hypothetical protein
MKPIEPSIRATEENVRGRRGKRGKKFNLFETKCDQEQSLTNQKHSCHEVMKRRRDQLEV